MRSCNLIISLKGLIVSTVGIRGLGKFGRRYIQTIPQLDSSPLFFIRLDSRKQFPIWLSFDPLNYCEGDAPIISIFRDSCSQR